VRSLQNETRSEAERDAYESEALRPSVKFAQCPIQTVALGVLGRSGRGWYYEISGSGK